MPISFSSKASGTNIRAYVTVRFPGSSSAYAFVASSDFQEVAQRLKDGLVEGASFNRLEVEELVKPNAGFDFREDRADYQHESDALPETPGATPEAVTDAIDRLPVSVKQRVQFDPAKRTLAVTGALSRDDRNTLQLAFAKVPGAERLIERLFLRSNRIQATARPSGWGRCAGARGRSPIMCG